MEILISTLSKVGSRERNEDSCGYWGDTGPTCCVLSDGAGGHGGGDVASRAAVRTVLEAFARRPECSSENIAELIASANREVVRLQSRGGSLRDMRATLVVLALDPMREIAAWGHIGDSRLYFLRNGFVESRTRDHSLLQALIDAGFAKVGDGHSADRSVLVASLGAKDDFEPEVMAREIALRSGDAFLLCSDGLWEHATDKTIETALQQSASPQDWLDKLDLGVTGARKPSQDNYSAIGLWYGPMNFATPSPAPGDAG
jgi:serine/threonine protein phosphatase PrpC